jgi:hypothetical protein
VEEPIKAVVLLSEICGELGNLGFELDVTDKDGRVADELLHLFAAGFAANGVDDLSARIDKHAGRMPGHALLIGDTHHEDAFAGELKKIVGHDVNQLTTEDTESTEEESEH